MPQGVVCLITTAPMSLCIIAVARMAVSRSSRLLYDSSFPANREAEPEQVLLKAELKKEVQAALDQTSPRERACIRALYYDGKKMRQYARETGCSHQFISKTTKNTLRRMRGLLKKRNVV